VKVEEIEMFIDKRKNNWNFLRKELDHLSDKFILPESALNADASWFGFLLTVKENSGFKRDELVNYLEPKAWKVRVKRHAQDASWIQDVFNQAEIK
jgi:CDP-6-deoxy-D-xylo-4-hexulose-3-dehydrase